MTIPPRFHVIDGTPEPETPAAAVRKRVKAMPKPAEMLSCPRCSGHEFIETKIGVLVQAGRHKGGTKTLICVPCLTTGHRVAVL